MGHNATSVFVEDAKALPGARGTKRRSVAANQGEERGTKTTVYAALVANLLIAVSKFVAAFFSGSSAMLAEGVHSVADTVNQVLLLVGLRTSKSAPDEEHPFGHGQDRFFWSFLVAVLILRRWRLRALPGRHEHPE